MRVLRSLSTALLAVIFVWIAVVNRQSVAVSIPFITSGVELPLFLWLSIAFLAGFGVATLLSMSKRLSRGVAAKKDHQKQAALEQEIAAIKQERAITQYADSK